MKPFLSKSPLETEKFAAKFSQSLKKGDVVALCGELGGGKTTFVRGLFEGMGGDPKYFVTSPTFTLFHEYPTKKGPLYHIDLYRLNSFREFEEIDLSDYLEGEGISVIEWGDKFPELKSQFTYTAFFKIVGKKRREVSIM